MVIAAIVAGSILGLVVLLGLVGLCLPRRWRIERSATIEAPPSTIFPLVNNFERGWKQWNPFVEPGMKIGYAGKPEGVGAVSTWERGRETGRMEITDSNPAKGIGYEIEMNNGFTMTARINLESSGKATKVVWFDEGEIGNPFFRFFPLFMKGMIGGKLEEGLRNIKAIAEKTPAGV